jgi:hypothetical protein
VLLNCLDIHCIAYLDDIVVYLNTLEEHQQHVRAVLKRLRNAGLCLKLSKCKINTKHIRFVSSIATSKGIKMEPDRIRTISEWPMPASYRDIQVFLEFANFYCCFIKDFLTIAKPLGDMLKGGKNGSFQAPSKRRP